MKTKKREIGLGLALLGHDVVIFISNNIAAVVRAVQKSVKHFILSCTSAKHQQRLRVEVFQIP